MVKISVSISPAGGVDHMSGKNMAPLKRVDCGEISVSISPAGGGGAEGAGGGPQKQRNSVFF